MIIREGFNKTARWTFYTAGGIMIAMGVISLVHPLVALVSTAILMGVGFLLAGINNLVPYFTIKEKAYRPKWLLILGIIDTVFGIVFLSRIGLAIFTVTRLLGIWVFLAGATRIYTSFQIKSFARKWWVMLVSGALMLIASVALLSNPVAAAIGVAFLTGFSLIGAGCLMIAEGRIIYPPE